MSMNTLFQKFIKTSIFVLAFALVYTMLANSNGSKTGLSETTSNGCSCHGSSSQNTSISASIDGGFIFKPNEKKTITINVENSGKSAAGLNASIKTQKSGGINIGELAAGVGTKIRSNEITHTDTKNFSGSSTDFTFDWTAPNEPGEYYLLAVGNAVNGTGSTGGDEYNWLEPVKITVKGIELINLLLNSNGKFCQGSEVIINWEASGVENIKIELSSDGGQNYDLLLAESISSESGSWTWNIASTLTVGDEYKLRLSDASDSEISTESEGEFSIVSGAMISEKIQSTTEFCEGSNVDIWIGVETAGAGVTVNWKKDGEDIQSDFSNTLTLEDFSKEGFGTYSCEIEDNCGSISSGEIVIDEINLLPIITSQPVDVETTVGSNFIIGIEVDDDNINYEWFKDGNRIANESGPSLNFINISLEDAGNYYCVVTNECGSSQSEFAEIKVNEDGDGPILTVSESSIEFGSVVIGENKKLLFEDFFTNDGDRPLIINKVSIIDDTKEAYTLKEFNATTVQPGNSRDILITFAPQTNDKFEAKLIVETIHGDNRTINILGFGVNTIPAVSSSVDELDFGKVELGKTVSETITIKNESNAEPVALNVIELVQFSPFDLDVDINFLQPYMLEKQEEVSFVVSFNPISDIGTFRDSVIIRFENIENIVIPLSAIATNIKSVREVIVDSKTYPLPANGGINFDLQLLENGEYDIRVINSLGAEVKRFDKEFLSNKSLDLYWDGQTNDNIQASSGVYYLIIEGEGSKSEIKFLINR